MDHTSSSSMSTSTTEVSVPLPNTTSPVSVSIYPSGSTTSGHINIGTTTSIINLSTTATSSCCNSSTSPQPEVYSHPNLTTTVAATFGTESHHEVTTTVLDDQGEFHLTKDGFGDYFDEHYSTPISILLLNFVFVIFLMIIIGIAVYPAMRKYCDSTTFPFGIRNGNRNNAGDNDNDGSNSYWIEDNEAVLSSSSLSSLAFLTTPRPLTSNVNDNDSDSSVALLNSTLANGPDNSGTFPSTSADFNSGCDIELLAAEEI